MSKNFVQRQSPMARSSHEQYEMLGGPFSDAGNGLDTWQSQDISKSNLQSSSFERQTRIIRPSWERIGNAFWLLEFGCWLLGFGCLAATVGVLARYDGRPVPVLRHGISLGALVSVLATAVTVFLTTPLAAGIGQARWLWFRKKRRLADFELITDAARSPFSALELVLRRKGGMLTMFGALFIVIVLAVNPFAQQVIKIDTRQVSHANATVPIANHYTINQAQGADSVDVRLTMKAAIYRGLLQIEAAKTAFNVNPNCPTGNCNWTTYETLSVCGRCVNLTDQLSSVRSMNSADQFTASLPNGLNLSWSATLVDQGLKTLTINNTHGPSSPRSESIHFENVNYSLANVFAIVGPYRKEKGPYASECVLQFCAQNMTANVTDGSFQETPIGEPVYLDRMSDGNVYIPDGNKNWTVEQATYRGLVSYFGNLFESYVLQSPSPRPTPQWPDDISQAVFYYMNTSSHTLDDMFSDLALSMSGHIRVVSPETSVGRAISEETYIHVRWAWMILPIIVVMAVLVFLIASVIATKRANLEPWKESSTALLAHGLDDRSRGLFLATDKKWELDEVAGQLRMCLDRVDGTANLRIDSGDRI